MGTALAQRRPVVVKGGEHFADAFVEMACAGAPIVDPRDGQVLGSLALCTRETNANSLMLPFLNTASWEIEQRLLSGNPLVERVLYQHFLGARRRTKRPIVLVGQHTMMTNAAADGLLMPHERERVWDWALRVAPTPAPASSEIHLANGVTAIADCEPIYDGMVIIGSIIRLRVNKGEGSLSRPVVTTDAEKVRFGWDSLTAAERRVADLVAQGCTNREAAAKLFLSWYTIDSHLRHIFAKLGVSSRVQLTRVATEHSKGR
jgi:DNA-binding CsgD family transcriptional regulator